MNPRSSGRVLGVLAAAVVGASSFTAAATAAPVNELATPLASGLQVGLGGTAYGSYAYDNDKTHVTGPVGMATLNCVTKTGLLNEADAASTDMGKLGRGGATKSAVKTFESGGTKGTVATTSVASAKLLAGLVEVGGVTSTSSASTDGKTFKGTNESKVASIKIAGRPIQVETAPNTVIDLALPGVGSIGRIEINKQFKGWEGDTYRTNTEALRIEILKSNPLGLQLGSTVRLGVSGAKVTKPIAGLLGGQGFATKASIKGKLIGHGPTANAYMPCTGGSSSGRINSLEIPGFLSTDGAEVNAKGTVNSSEAKSVVTTKIAGVRILGGLISLDGLTAKATATKQGGPVALLNNLGLFGPRKSATKLSDAGTQFVNLKIAGRPLLSDSIGPNTVIKVAGIGTVTLRKTERTATRIRITMLEIVIGNPNLGLPEGAKVEVGYATAAVK